MTRTGAALFGATFVLVTGVQVANATNFGSTASQEFAPGRWTQVSLANNKMHTVDFFATTTRVGNLTQWALNNQFPRFGFNWDYVDGSSYDVRVSDDDFGDIGAYAWVNCPAGATESGSNPNRVCHGQTLKYNLYNPYDAGWNTEFGGHNLACHELGHTVGLRHESAGDQASCMQSHESPDASDTRNYSQEDINHVLAAY